MMAKAESLRLIFLFPPPHPLCHMKGPTAGGKMLERPNSPLERSARARHQDQGAEVVQVGARLRAARPPVLVMEAAEVPASLLLPIQVAHGEVQPQSCFAQRRAPEHPGL